MSRQSKAFQVAVVEPFGEKDWRYRPVADVADSETGRRWIKKNGKNGAVYAVVAVGTVVKVAVETRETRTLAPTARDNLRRGVAGGCPTP